MRKGNYVEVLKQHLKTTARKLNLGQIWVFRMDINPKIAAKVETK